MSNIILIAQPRSGGVFTMHTLAKIYGCDPMYEFFNTHSYGFDTAKYSSDIDYKVDCIRQLNSTHHKIVKVSWWDIKDIQNEILQLDARWFHLERTDPVEMVASSFLSYYTGIFHKKNSESFDPIKEVVIPKEFVEDFFSSHNGGGWHFNKAENIPILNKIDYTRLSYNDTTTETDIINMVGGSLNKELENDTVKLYPNKKGTILNYDDVKRWVVEFASK